MNFEFEKFIVDIENRQTKQQENKTKSQQEIDLDQQRRLRAERYHEDGRIESYGSINNAVRYS